MNKQQTEVVNGSFDSVPTLENKIRILEAIGQSGAIDIAKYILVHKGLTDKDRMLLPQIGRNWDIALCMPQYQMIGVWNLLLNTNYISVGLS